jgi:hypothetical protein
MRTLLLIEPALTGHRFRFIRWFTDEALARGWNVVISTDPVYRLHPALQTMGGRERVAIRFHDFTCQAGVNTAAMIRQEFAYRRHFRTVFRTARQQGPIDLVVIPYVDYCLYAMGLMGSPFEGAPWAGVAMRPAFHYHAFGLTSVRPSALTRIKRQLFLRLTTSHDLAALAVLDPYLAKYVARRRPNSRVHYLQDPTDAAPPSISRDSARHRLGLPPERPIVLLYGSIDTRKGVRELLAAHASQAPDHRPHVVLAGRLHVKVKAAPDVTIMDRFISDEEESLLFAACNVVWIGYRGHLGSSGVLWQSLAFHRPVIACKDGLVGRFTQDANLGVTVDVENHTDIAAVLRDLPIFAPNGALRPLAGRDFAASLFKLAGMI